MNVHEAHPDVKLLQTLGTINEAMIEIAGTMRTRRSISRVTRVCDIRNYTNGTVFESYVEAETKSGVAYCWWIDLRHAAGMWTIERSIRKTTDDEQDTIKDFPEGSFRTVHELSIDAKVLLKEFFSSATEFNFDGR
jgi:hypothetical protein